MDYIINFLSSIWDFIQLLADFVSWLITSAIETLFLGIEALTATAYYVSQFPVYWLAPFTAIITIAVIFKLKG